MSQTALVELLKTDQSIKISEESKKSALSASQNG